MTVVVKFLTGENEFQGLSPILLLPLKQLSISCFAELGLSGSLAAHLLTPLPKVLPPQSALLESASGLGPRASSPSVHSFSFMPMALNPGTGFPDLCVGPGSIRNWLLHLTIQHLKFSVSPTGPHICSLKTAPLNE